MTNEELELKVQMLENVLIGLISVAEKHNYATSKQNEAIQSLMEIGKLMAHRITTLEQLLESV